VKRKLLVSIGAIVVLLMLVALPGCVSQSTYDQLKATYDSLVSGNTDLRQAYDQLMTDYDNFKNSYAGLQQAYDDFVSLVAQHESFKNTPDVQQAYDDLKAEYENFKNTYGDLKQAYDDLSQQFEDLKHQLGLD
jgi:predicted  nucleic acid-binding Zn-ribbon protein